MAITDYKITDGEITQRNVKSAPDVLSDTPNNNKAVFDNLTEHFIGKYNDLIDNIDTDFVDSSEFAEGLTVTDKVRWRYALTKGASIGLNFSGNITPITTGFRTIVGDIDNLTETDFMDCYLSINGTDYECGDSYASGNSILTSAVINGVTVEIIYDTANGNITLEHTTNPLDTLYWNVSIYRSVAEKVPRKALPASVSNDGYTELMEHGKWHGVELNESELIELKTRTVSVSVSSTMDRIINFAGDKPYGDELFTANQTALTTTPKSIGSNISAQLITNSDDKVYAVRFSTTSVSMITEDVELSYYVTPMSGAVSPLITDSTNAYKFAPADVISRFLTPTYFSLTPETSFELANINAAQCYKIGRLCIIKFFGHLTSSLAAGSSVDIMTLPNDLFPYTGTSMALSYASGREIHATVVSGVCKVRVKNTGSSAIGTSTSFGVNAVYITQ